jgi:2-polyprenyl-3-methyl-5-hydroxy-6-metoxy-1,4-benzoquinol methylase
MTSKESYYSSPRSDMMPFLPEHFSRVLEIGCGEGGFANNLRPDIEIWGIEPVCEIKNPVYTAIRSDYRGAFDQLPDHYFDHVVCNDVIEHMDDHDFFFSSIQQKLQPGGYLVASIPNVRHYRTLRSLLFNKDWKYDDEGVLDRTHLRFFTKKSLLRTLREHGYEVARFRGINTPRFYNVFVLLFNVLTLFTNLDIRYLQYAFLARTASTPRQAQASPGP